MTSYADRKQFVADHIHAASTDALRDLASEAIDLAGYSDAYRASLQRKVRLAHRCGFRDQLLTLAWNAITWRGLDPVRWVESWLANNTDDTDSTPSGFFQPLPKADDHAEAVALADAMADGDDDRMSDSWPLLLIESAEPARIAGDCCALVTVNGTPVVTVVIIEDDTADDLPEDFGDLDLPFGPGGLY